MRLSTSNSKPVAASLRWFVGAFAVMLFCVVVATESLLRLNVIPHDNFDKHVSLFQSADAHDAAFGDSHTARGFVADRGFVNLAYPSEGITQMAWKVETYYADRTPGRVILQAAPHLFAPYRLRASVATYPETSDINAAPLRFHLLERRHRVRLLEYWISFVGNGFRLESRVQYTEGGALLSDGDFSELSPRLQSYEARARARMHSVESTSLVDQAKQDYAEMIMFLKMKGADICLVSYPVTSEYLSEVETTHEPIVAFFWQQAELHGLTYFDGRQELENNALFRDPDHLNVQGANQFSRTLVEVCFS